MSKWEMVRLGDEIKVTSGGTPSRAINEYWIGGAGDTLVPWVKTGDLKSMYLSEVDESITTTGLQNCSAKMFPKDTLLVAMYGATIGACSILNIPASTNQACAALLPNNKYLPAFLYYYFLSIKDKLISMGVGGAQPNISGTMIQSLKIPLPPLDVQHHIADVLNRVGTLIEKRKAQIDKLDLLVKSRFVEMFGDPVTNPMGWEVKRLESLGTLKNGMNFRNSDSGASIKCLGVGDFHDHTRIDGVSNLSEINLNVIPPNDYLLHDGDIVFVRSNGNKALVGRSVVVNLDEEQATFSGFCIRFRLTEDDVIVDYIAQLLRHSSVKFQMFRDVRGANITNLNQKILSALDIPTPPLPLQHRFADFVRATDKSKFVLQRGLDKLEFLYQSLMQKCFAGELFN